MLPQIKPTDFIQENGHYWMTAESLGDKLGFVNQRKSVLELFRNHKDEIEPFSTVLKTRAVDKKNREIRVFDEQGCYIIAMLAKTEQAKLFRRALAQFLKSVREQQLSFFEMQDEYDELRSKLAAAHLQERLNKLGISAGQFRRMVELKPVLSIKELTKLFDVGQKSLWQLFKLYRHSTGDFNDYQPAHLRLTAGGYHE